MKTGKFWNTFQNENAENVVLMRIKQINGKRQSTEINMEIYYEMEVIFQINLEKSQYTKAPDQLSGKREIKKGRLLPHTLKFKPDVQAFKCELIKCSYYLLESIEELDSQSGDKGKAGSQKENHNQLDCKKRCRCNM